MTKFVVIYHAPKAFFDMMKDVTPEQAAAGMKPWMDWADKCGSALVDMGAPLANGLRMQPDGHAPSDKEVAGYSILEAENMEAAKTLLDGHPHLVSGEGCTLEVHEAMPLPGM